MPVGRLVVVEADEWVLRLLEDGLRDAGFEVAPARGAAEGLAKIRFLGPDCVLCAARLADGDGYGVARALRADDGALQAVPVLLLADEDDDRARLQALQSGADATMTKPFRMDEVVAQVNALLALADRVRRSRTSSGGFAAAGPPSAPASAALKGDLSQMSLPTLLSLLEMERRTGTLQVRAGSLSATLDVADGRAVGATLNGSPVAPIAVVRQVLRARAGRFSFRPAPPGPATPGGRPPAHSIGQILLEAVRLDDESDHAPPSRARPSRPPRADSRPAPARRPSSRPPGPSGPVSRRR